MKKTYGILTAAVTFGLMMTTGGAAFAQVTTDSVPTSTVNLSVDATADGSPGVTTGASFNPTVLTPGVTTTTTMQMGTTTPANVCRTLGNCAPGTPNNGAVLTFSGLAAAGLTFVSNGDTSAGCVQQDLDTVVCHYQYFNNYHKSDNFVFSLSPTATPGDYTIKVALHLFDKTLPTAKSQCKDGGWAGFYDALYTPVFKNQGDCVSFIATGGKNSPSGS